MSNVVKTFDAPPGVWTKLIFREAGNLPSKVDLVNSGLVDVNYSTDAENPTVTGTLSAGQSVINLVNFVWVYGSADDAEVSLRAAFANPIVASTDPAQMASDIAALQTSELTVGWDDLLGQFSTASNGQTAPTVVIHPNGKRGLLFDNGNSLYVDYHTVHNGIDGSNAFAHIHMYTDSAMAEGETITWDAIYISARGYTQGDSLLAPRTTVTFTYTAPAGGVLAGDPIILEGVSSTFPLLEPDSTIQIEWKKTGGTFAGDVFGIQADIHYQTLRDNTANRNYPFS